MKMKPAWNFSLLQFAIKLTSLISFMQCIHIEDPYEHMDKYYQYGYQVDDHYTGEGINLLMILNFSPSEVTTTVTWSTPRAS